MKKRYIRRALVLVTLIVLSLTLVALVTSAEGASDSAVPDGAVWQITHKSGAVEYSTTFNGAFSKISDGDTFKLLPKTYNVYKADYANVRPSSAVTITIDLRGTTVIAPETGDINDQIFDISDSNKGATVNVLMENAVIYAAPGGRCAFSAGGGAVVNIDGGEDGGKIYAGAALNLNANYPDESTYSTIKNMYCFKSTANMAGMICARNTSKLKVIDTYAVAASSNTILYVRNSGCMILENSHAISLGSSNVVEFVEATDETSFTLGRGSTLYGNIKGLSDPDMMKIAAGTHFDRVYSATLIGDSYIASSSKQITRTVYSSAKVGEESSESLTLSYPYTAEENIIVTDTQTSDSVWKLEGSGATKFVSTLSALNTIEGAYAKATLLSDIEISEATVLELSSDLVIDLGGKKLTLASGADVGYAFNVSGEAGITLALGSSEVNLIGTGLLRANNDGDVTLTSSGKVAADVLVSKSRSEGTLTVVGGAYLFRLGSGFASVGDIEIKSISIASVGAGVIVSSEGSVKVESSALSAASSAEAIMAEGDLTFVLENYIVGKVSAEDIVAGDYSYFTEKPVYVSISTPLVVEKTDKQINVLAHSGGILSLVARTVSFEYYTRKYTLSDTAEPGSVWKLEDEGGNVKYTDHVYTPFLDLSEFVNYTLLSDLNLNKNFHLALVGDIKIDLASNKISLATGYTKDDPVFDILGDGVVTLAAESAILDVSGATLVATENVKGITLDMGDSFISADTVVNATGTPITANGGYYSVKKTAFASTGGNIDLSALSVHSANGATLVSSDADVTVNEDVTLAVQNGGKAITTTAKLMVADGVYIYGNVDAAEFYSAGSVSFTLKPTFEYSNMLVVQNRENKEITTKSLSGDKITESKLKLVMSYTTVNITDGLKVSMHLASSATLNVYVPTAIVNSDPGFTIRIVLDGLLMEAKAADGTAKTVDGKSYVRFSYPYVYPNLYDEEAKITLLSATFTGTESIGISTYLERTMELTASDELRAVIASYAAYSAECSGVKLASDSPFAEYAKELTVYHEADADLLFDYFRSVRYEPSVSELRFTPWTSCDYTVDIAYKFGDSDFSYTFVSKDGAFAIPVYRFVMSGDFVMTFTDSAGAKTLNINLYDLADFAEQGSDTRLLLTLYLAYANALSACTG